MKNIFLKIGYLTVFVLLFAACEKEDYTGHSTAIFVKPAATYTSVSGASITLNESTIDPENGKSYVFSATLSSPSLVDTYIDLTKVGGNLSSSEFETTDIYIPAQALTGTGTVTIFRSADAEPTETLQIKANANGHSANVSGTSAVYTITVTGDYHSVNVEMDWKGTYTYNTTAGSVTLDFSKIDLDILLFDSSFNLLNFFGGATGAVPEHEEFSMLANGTYYLVADLYANPLATALANRPVPLKFVWDQENMASGSFVFNFFNTNMTSGTEIVAEIVVLNGVYTIIPAQ